jgi:hypothetical protein
MPSDSINRRQLIHYQRIPFCIDVRYLLDKARVGLSENLGVRNGSVTHSDFLLFEVDPGMAKIMLNDHDVVINVHPSWDAYLSVIFTIFTVVFPSYFSKPLAIWALQLTHWILRSIFESKKLFPSSF